MNSSVNGFWPGLRTISLTCLMLNSLSAQSAPSKFVTPKGAAPNNVMAPSSQWDSAIKQAFGTAYEAYDSNNKYSGSSPTAPISKVWFTATQGALSEIYWPTIDTAQVKDSQFLVTDGKTFFFEEKRDAQTSSVWLQTGVPAYRVTNRDPKGRFVIEKTLFTDPDRDSVIERVKITSSVPGLKFYILHKPAAQNTPLGDYAKVSTGAVSALYGWQGQHVQALVSSIGFKDATAGFSGGAGDGWAELTRSFQLQSHFETASNGNVVLTAQLDLPEVKGVNSFDLVLSFGASIDAARSIAQATLSSGVNAALSKYTQQWQGYQSSIRDLSSASLDGGKLFRSSVALIKSMEDKTYEGAFVASPTIPWGNHTSDSRSILVSQRRDDNIMAGYHAVWPRDLFQMATSFLAIDDPKSSIASLNFLRRVQFQNSGASWSFGNRQHSKNGSFMQCLWVNGDQRWTGLQMDETAMPIMLAHRLWKANKIDPSAYWNMVRSAADFISEFGPWSHEERWEESMGASPSTIAAEVSALWVAAEFADQAKDSARAKKYRATADGWAFKPGDSLDAWLFTTTGSLGRGRYYERVEGAADFSQKWDPNDNAIFTQANQAGDFREKDVTDGGFLELVRYGVKAARAPTILDSIQAYDQSIRVDIPGKGASFHRYFGDRYNFEDSTGNQTAGMPWPILTGERGHYELAKAVESGSSAQGIRAAVSPWIKSMENFSTSNHMIPEQVWKDGPGAGSSTGAATPLGWAHGEYIKLLRSTQDLKVFDLMPSVSARRQSLEGLRTHEMSLFE